MKRTIRLRESELRRMISESVKRTLNEVGETTKGLYKLGAAAGRNELKGWDEDKKWFERSEKLTNHAMSKIENNKTVKTIFNLLDGIYDNIRYYCPHTMDDMDYDAMMQQIDRNYSRIKEEVIDLATEAFNQGFQDFGIKPTM